MPILTEMLNSENGFQVFSWFAMSCKLDQAIDPIVESLSGAQPLQSGSGKQSTSVLLLFSMTDLLYTLYNIIYTLSQIHLYNL